jgi:hypothetical protein
MTQKAPFKHPECRPDEVFLGNSCSNVFMFGGKSTWSETGWESKRQGKVAYDRDGKRITNSNMFPVFVLRQELEANGIDPDNMSNPYGN